MNIKLGTSCIAFFLFFSVAVRCQVDEKQKDLFKWFDSKIGDENRSIYDGVVHKVKYKTKNGNHKYFKSSKFLEGNIIYDNQPYYDIMMNYDIYEDELIVKLSDQLGNTSNIELMKRKIKGFSILGHQFTKIEIPAEDKKESGSYEFYEIVLEKEQLNLYIKHHKTRKKKMDSKFTYSFFEKGDSNYLLLIDSKYHKIKKKKNWIYVFPNQKKTINTFYKKNKTMLKTNKNEFMLRLAVLMNDLITK